MKNTNNFIEGLSKSFFLVAKYFDSLLNENEKRLMPKYRIVKYRHKNGITFCEVYIIGTRCSTEHSASEIMADDDLTRGFSPLDVRTLCNLANFDLYHSKQKDNVISIVVDDRFLAVTYLNDVVIHYDLLADIDINTILSPRVSYILGCMKTEKLMTNSNQKEPRFKIIHDNVTTLEILDEQTREVILMNPRELLFSEKSAFFSKSDIAKIGYMCGQMSLLTER